jgi:hypothetical protein
VPDTKAVRKGARLVIIRHGDREAQLFDDGSAFVIRFRAGDGLPTLSGLVDRDRRDSYTQRDHINIYDDTWYGVISRTRVLLTVFA